MEGIKPYTSSRTAFFAALLAAIVFVFLFFFLGINQRKHTYEDAKQLAKEISRNAARETELFFKTSFDKARSIAQSATIYQKTGADRQEVVELLKSATLSNPSFLAVWTMWEHNAYDGKDDLYQKNQIYDTLGNFSVTFFRRNDTLYIEETQPDDYFEDYYTIPKETQKEYIIEPYFYIYDGYPYVYYETSIVIPLFADSSFLGVVGLDLNLDSLQRNLQKIKPFNSGYLSLISYQGQIISHLDTSFITKNFYEYLRNDDTLTKVQIEKGIEFSLETISEFTGKKVFRFFYPFNIGIKERPWSMMVEIPIEDATQRTKVLIIAAFSIMVIGLALIFFLIFNILDRKRYEQAILEALNEIESKNRIAIENAQNYMEIFNSTNEAIFIHDADTGEIVDVNNVMLQMYGYSSKDEVKLKKLDDFSIDAKEGEQSLAKTYLAKSITDGAQVFESHAKRKNGELFFVEVSLKYTLISGKSRILGVVRDITERKEAEKELAASEKKYRSLIETMNEAVMFVDSNDNVLYINKRFTEKLGYLPEDIHRKNGYEILMDYDSRKHISKSTNVKSKQLELTFRGKTGGKLDFIVSESPLFNSNEELEGFVLTMTDITEKKKVERELELYSENLEYIVKERTEELETANEELSAINEELYDQRKKLENTLKQLQSTQKQLIQVEKMASLGVLTAGIAHEINNPLNFISGGVLGLKSYVKDNFPVHDQNIEALMMAINEGVRRTCEIVESLNRYSMKSDLPKMESNINTILDGCLVLLYNKTKNRIEIEKQYCCDEIIVYSNEGQLQQAFLNILTNAVYAIGDKGKIVVKTDLDANNAYVSITDNGCGISKENLTKITDPFFTTKPPGQGTGLGLSITYSIISEHGGTLEFDSEKGKGTTVNVILPRVTP